MSVDDLAADMEQVQEAAVVFDDAPVKPLSEEVQAHLAKLLGAPQYARDVWCVARDHGVPAATLFKLSDGNIDPRPSST